MPTASTKKEQIDERILRILGLNPEEVEMDYITYHNALRESLVKGAKSGLPQEELALIANERSRIRNKKGRFQVKTKKVKINNNNLNSPIKEKRKMLPGATKKEGPSQTKGGALVKSDSSTTDIVNTQGKLLSNLVKTLNFNLKEERKLEKEKQNLIAKKEDTEKKQKTETDIEKKKGPSKISKLADKLLAPVKNLFEGIFDYIKLTALNFVVGAVYKWFTDPANKKKVEKIKNFFTSIGDWFQNPENQKKLSTIGRFLKDNWKIILGIGGVILLWNSGIGAIVGAIGFAVKGIGATLLLLAKNPLIAAAIGIGAGVAYLSSLPSEPNADVDESVEEVGKEKTLDILKEQQENRNIFQKMGDFITGAGSEREEQIYRLETGEEKRYNKGGMVPVMLTKGEWVVPPEQVQKIGVNKLTNINNIGNYNRGGNVYTNTDEFNLGGLVPGRGPNVDTVRTVLPEGSYVIQRPSVDILGAENIPGMIANLGEFSGKTPNRSPGRRNVVGRENLPRATRAILERMDAQRAGNLPPDKKTTGPLLGRLVMGMGDGSWGLPPGLEGIPGLGGGGGGTNALTSQAKVRSIPGMLRSLFDSFRKKEIDPQTILENVTSKSKSVVTSIGGTIVDGNSQEQNMKRVMSLPPEMREAVLADMNRSDGKVKESSGGSIRNFLKLNTGGEVSGSAGVGGKIVEGAKRIIGYMRGEPDMCARTTRAALKAAGHPAASKRTQVGDLDTPKGTAFNGPDFAASFGGSDMGKIITQKSQIKPGDIILWRALRDINPAKNITKGAITHVGIAADNGLKHQYDHSQDTGFRYRSHWDTDGATKWFAGIRLGASGGMLPPELPAGGVSGGGGAGGSGDGRDNNSSPFASSGMGMLLKELGFTNDKGESIGSPITNSKIKDVSSTSPTDIGEAGAGGETTATVSSLSPSNETKDMRQGPGGRATETMVRQGVNSVTLYDWSYEKIYGIQGA